MLAVDLDLAPKCNDNVDLFLYIWRSIDELEREKHQKISILSATPLTEQNGEKNYA